MGILDTRQTKCVAAFLAGAALIATTSCGQVLGLRDDYYEVPLVSGAAGDGSPSAGAGAESGSGGTPDLAGSGGVAAGSSGGAPPSDAGTGGAEPVPTCDLPITKPELWKATSWPIYGQDPPAGLIDGTSRRWTTGKPQKGDEWLQIDFGATVSLSRVILQQGGTRNDFPRGYRVVVSDIPQNLTGEPIKVGFGEADVSTIIKFPRIVNGRYLLIQQTVLTRLETWWSADEIEFECF